MIDRIAKQTYSISNASHQANDRCKEIFCLLYLTRRICLCLYLHWSVVIVSNFDFKEIRRKLKNNTHSIFSSVFVSILGEERRTKWQWWNWWRYRSSTGQKQMMVNHRYLFSDHRERRMTEFSHAHVSSSSNANLSFSKHLSVPMCYVLFLEWIYAKFSTTMRMSSLFFFDLCLFISSYFSRCIFGQKKNSVAGVGLLMHVNVRVCVCLFFSIENCCMMVLQIKNTYIYIELILTIVRWRRECLPGNLKGRN